MFVSVGGSVALGVSLGTSVAVAVALGASVEVNGIVAVSAIVWVAVTNRVALGVIVGATVGVTCGTAILQAASTSASRQIVQRSRKPRLLITGIINARRGIDEARD